MTWCGSEPKVNPDSHGFLVVCGGSVVAQLRHTTRLLIDRRLVALVKTTGAPTSKWLWNKDIYAEDSDKEVRGYARLVG